MGNLQFTTCKLDDILIIDFQADFAGPQASELQETIIKYIGEAEKPRIILNFDKYKIDSSGLGMVLFAYNTMRKNFKCPAPCIIILEASNYVKGFFRQSKLDYLSIDFSDDLEQAISILSGVDKLDPSC